MLPKVIEVASTRVCKACGLALQGAATREHVLPRWLHQYVELPGVNLEHRVVNESGSTLLRTHGLNNFAFRSLCQTCNNTWMSKLESDAKPILLPLIEEKRSTASLTPSESNTLSRWAFKTSFMILAGQKRYRVPWEVFRAWVDKGSGRPDSAFIFAIGNLHVEKGFSYITEADELAGNESPINLRIAIAIRSLLLITLLPLDHRPRVAGVGHSAFRLLSPPDSLTLNKPTEVDATTTRTYADYIKYLSGFVHAGVLVRRRE